VAIQLIYQMQVSDVNATDSNSIVRSGL